MGHDDVVSSMVLELRRGTLVMLVLGQLREPAYGYALVKSLAEAQWRALCGGVDKLLEAGEREGDAAALAEGEERDHVER